MTEPLIFFGWAYSSYIFAEFLKFSGTISVVTCGFLQTGYGRYNIDPRSDVSMSMFIKIAAKSSELLIFLLLGNSIMTDTHELHLGFIAATVGFTLIWRIISKCTIFFHTAHEYYDRFTGIVMCSWIANAYFIPNRQINFVEGVIMAFGGMRGSIAFSLSIQLKDRMENANLFISTILFVVVWTVFVYGTSMKP